MFNPLLPLQKWPQLTAQTHSKLKIEKPKITLLKMHISMKSESSKLKFGRIRQQKSVKLCIQSIDLRKSDLRNVKDL